MKSVTLSDIESAPAGQAARNLIDRLLHPAQAGRLEVTTRFQACHLAGTLDDALAQLGYTPAVRAPGRLRYQARTAGALWRKAEVDVTVHAHALDVTGPLPTLSALRRQLAC
jgi:hypothetical protein